MGSPSILVIDDDPDISELISFNLRKIGFQVIQGGSGLEALWLLKDLPLPSCILLDIMMPSPDGRELCQFLKTTPAFKNIPLILLSARGTGADISLGMTLGADAYVVKPFRLQKTVADDPSPYPLSAPNPCHLNVTNPSFASHLSFVIPAPCFRWPIRPKKSEDCFLSRIHPLLRR